MNSPEDYRRLEVIYHEAEKDGIRPDKYIAREIRGALARKNPFFDENHDFFVLGFDGFDSSIFPVGSFQTPEEALNYAKQKRSEEHLFTDNLESDIATTFHVYTKDGILVRPPEKLS